MAQGFFKLAAFSMLFPFCGSAFASQSIDLSQQDISILRTLSSQRISTLRTPIAQAANIEELKRAVDFNRTLHVRIQQTYEGYPVWGSDAVVHIPNGEQIRSQTRGFMDQAEKTKSTMSGTMYANLESDLKTAPAYIFKEDQAKKALAEAIASFKSHYHGTCAEPEKKQVALKVYVDDESKAHWVFHVSFYLQANGLPVKPNFLMDAVTLKPYLAWNDVKHLENENKPLESIKGGGFGGNIKMGKLSYDGLAGHLPALDMTRNPNNNKCYLKNSVVTVSDFRSPGIARFNCEKPDLDHNNLYWDGEQDSANFGYSPNNDALYAGKVVSDLYQTWYQIPVLSKNNKPMRLEMVTHSPNYNFMGVPDEDNALWDSEKQKMYFGDGHSMFYPLTSIGVAAHEISHGFTEQHSNLSYFNQSGGLNEAFSDMAAQAAEYFSLGRSSWQIGHEITKEKYSALRYMDEPSRDCYALRPDAKPGENCSIDTMRDYDGYLVLHHSDSSPYTKHPSVHFSSGVFNRAFYLLAHSPNWDVKKAFDVMVQANRYYWTSSTTFIQAACGVKRATKDYGYDMTGVTKAFAGVGIDVNLCRM